MRCDEKLRLPGRRARPPRGEGQGRGLQRAPPPHRACAEASCGARRPARPEAGPASPKGPPQGEAPPLRRLHQSPAEASGRAQRDEPRGPRGVCPSAAPVAQTGSVAVETPGGTGSGRYESRRARRPERASVRAGGFVADGNSFEGGLTCRMALPTIPSFWRGRCRMVEQQIVRQREQEARFRQKWELNSLYFKQSGVYSSKQAQWNSRQSYQQSMNAYHREKLKEEKQISLEQRRLRLQQLLCEEREMLAAELQALRLDKDAYLSEMRQKNEALKSAREERRKQVAEDLLYERWKNNSAKLRKVGSDLHQKHVVEAWGDQLAQKQQQEATEREEKVRSENQYEAARKEALERMKEEAEKRKRHEKQQAEFLQMQMEELKLREVEAAKLKKEEENLLKQHWELEALESERKRQEQDRKKAELGRFLKHQYRAQMKRRAQQIQEELEKDRQILLALSDEDDQNRRLQRVRREEAIAAVAWMREVIEKQLQLEREREAELETIFREEAKRVWEKREEEWARERKARDRLMAEVLAERERQIQERMELNRKAQQESVMCREQLIQELEEAKQLTQREKEEEAVLKTARKRELEAQLTERQRQQEEELQQRREEEAAARLEQQREEELEQLEARRLAGQGYRHKNYSYPKTAWT